MAGCAGVVQQLSMVWELLDCPALVSSIPALLMALCCCTVSSQGSHGTGVFGKLDISKAHKWKRGSFSCGGVNIAKPLGPPVGHGEQELRLPSF